MSDVLTPRHALTLRPEQPWFVLSAEQHYSVIASEHPAISHFYSFNVAQTASQTMAVPDGCVDILFDCNASSPTGRVCGTTLEARSAELISGHHYFGVRFVPGVIPDFLDLMAEEITDREFSFLDVIPGSRLALEQIVETPLFSRKIELFNRNFTPRLLRKSSASTPGVIQAIHQQRGNIRMEQLEALTGYSCRTLQRQFRQDTGMSPKAFSRIIRCQSALNTLHQHGSMTSSDLAFDLGFSDQSHFLREFKKLVSTTPLDYQRRIAQEIYDERIRYN
ncbi:helix-turn-helix domain-containing protein [Rouxiella badensis]|jgi:AraC-like DNA-binding protein|uniref:AraC family transcriptional regulator n=1 Tax=Rouxiella badensis TaxID=1646377 RepID=A0A1X0WGT5_9GAMM|nr:helix-turn-helix domain-containing protein [Rouxiella badensis]MCC3701613.1 helix-turn-helix domain-containing protein [Rouxiella badensis]MCC3719370.1 helix-turn-helix domain-containing protein [Rouxiella badensis]MCC3728620.1 helix-turn-helix domain-containing protein [Rouxiella badensis]MCC3739384.1 helix-turn-helix domain-containing protein [Rouxiella badensis]ORJ25970.1 AraC family transcriptional regulator [Rouxiella badensis]